MASQFQLVMRSGPTPGKVYELLQDELTIGRDINNGVVINDPEISRRHSRLRAQADSFTIEDLGSTNGTFVNGQRLMGPHMLRPGEVVMLGEHIGLVFEAVYDPNATVVSSNAQETFRVPQQTPQTMPAPQPYETPYQEPAYQQPSYQQPPSYSGQIPQGPPDPYLEQPAVPYAQMDEAPAPKRNILLIGCISLLVLGCVCLGAFAVFDALDLYCSGPFAGVTEMIFGSVCP